MSVHALRTHTQDQERAGWAAETARLKADLAMMREGNICLLHQLAAAREWRARVTLAAVVGGFAAIVAMRAIF